MAAVHSSVRPPKSKLPWGTILKPTFGLGHQKMNEYEIEQTVNRLSQLPPPKQRPYVRNNPKMDPDAIDDMVGMHLQKPVEIKGKSGIYDVTQIHLMEPSVR